MFLIIILIIDLMQIPTASSIVLTREKESSDNAPSLTGTSDVPGILIGNNRSSACSEVTLRDINFFYLCFFLQLKNESSNLESNNTLIELRDSKSTFELTYGNGGLFLISYRGFTHGYPMLLEFDDWTKICIHSIDGEEVEFEVNSRTVRNNMEYYEYEQYYEYEEYDTRHEHSQHLKRNMTKWPTGIRNISTSSICIGSYDTIKSSVIGSIAGITLKKYRAFSSINESCLDTNDNETSYLMKKPKITHGYVNRERYSLSELCWSMYAFLFVEDDLNYFEHASSCRYMHGRLMLPNEATEFSDELEVIFIDNTNSSLDKVSQFHGNTWLFDNSGEPTTKSCHAFNIKEMQFSSIPCKLKMTHNLCMIPKYSDFYYFGPSGDFDHHYTLQTKNNSIYLKGDESSFLEQENKSWILRSKFHKNSLFLYNRTVPVGRNHWKNWNGNHEYLMTITNCEIDEFACSSGECVTRESRCNYNEECQDYSDEELCDAIDKRDGYITNIQPPPRDIEFNLTIAYKTTISTTANISPTDGIAHLDLHISLTWFDPRISFKVIPMSREIDCSDIWIPNLDLENEGKTILKLQNFYQRCFFNLETDLWQERIVSKKDPYMGHHVDGQYVELSTIQGISLAVPCNLKLRRYPFGIENCNFRLLLRAGSLKAHEDMDSTELRFHRQTILREFLAFNFTHRLDSNENSVTINFEVQTIYGYHLINSFAPSFLICLIAFCSLFFPVTDFNERIMVSLVALLALATLLTLSSNVFSRTSKVNYLDIWYLGLISFCFFAVIINVLIHNIEFHGRKIQESNIHSTNIRCNIIKINYLFKITFVILFTLFLVTFCLGAADII